MTDAYEITRPAHERRPALFSCARKLLAVPIPLERDEARIGRALEADVRVNDARASRLHARIRTERDQESGETSIASSTSARPTARC